MKKKYLKPSLLSETFVTENIMAGELSAIPYLWTLTGTEAFQGIQFNTAEGGNTLYKVNFSDFNPQ